MDRFVLTREESSIHRARLTWLRTALVAVGAIFVLGIAPLTRLWPSGWSWGTGHSHYLPMILGVYATLGVFLLLAARDPLRHRSLIWFTVWSSVVHALIMAAEAVADASQRGHLLGDVPALLIVAGVLAALVPSEAQPAAAAVPRSARNAA